MSMLFVMLGLTPAQIEILMVDPSLISDVVTVANRDEGNARFAKEIEALPPQKRNELKAELREGTTEFAKNQRNWDAEIAEMRQRLEVLGPIERPLDLQKMWHILHYGLTGNEELTGGPGDMLLAGEEFGPEVGYGPPRLHTPSETAYYSRFIETLDVDDLQNELNFSDMGQAGVYPLSPGRRDPQYDAGFRKDFYHAFVRLQDYLSRMADKGNGLLMWVH